MAWLPRFWADRHPPVVAIAGLAVPPGDPRPSVSVVIEGVIEALDDAQLVDPATGRVGVALEYRASAPGALSRAYAGLLGPMTDVEMRARQAVDFLVRDASGVALVRTDPGQSIEELHDTLGREHGLALRTQTAVLSAGERVRVRGLVEEVFDESPLRRGPWRAVVWAEQVERVSA